MRSKASESAQSYSTLKKASLKSKSAIIEVSDQFKINCKDFCLKTDKLSIQLLAPTDNMPTEEELKAMSECPKKQLLQELNLNLDQFGFLVLAEAYSSIEKIIMCNSNAMSFSLKSNSCLAKYAT